MSENILGSEWHVSAEGIRLLNEIVGDNQATNKHNLVKAALDVDLKTIAKPFLANEVNNGKTSKAVLQIQKIRNISAPKSNEGSQAAPRMLKLTLTDGESYTQAIELSTISAISRDKTPPGTKVRIDSAKIVGGYLLLSPENCTVLGGQVPHMVEKWLLAKSVQQSHNKKASNDGAPPWVPFGSKLSENNLNGVFKSLGSENKDAKIENSEFEQQRKEAIAEASTVGFKKTFGGRAKQNVQPTSSRNNFQDRGKRNNRANGRGSEDYEALEKPQKPAEKVSLFDFLSDKLPITETKPQESTSYRKPSNNYQYNSSKPNHNKDNGPPKFEKNNPTPSQASKGYNRTKTEEPSKNPPQFTRNLENQNDTQNRGKSNGTYYHQPKSSNSYDQQSRNLNYHTDKGHQGSNYNKNSSASQGYNKYNSSTHNNIAINYNTQSNTAKTNDGKNASNSTSVKAGQSQQSGVHGSNKTPNESYNNRQPPNPPPVNANVNNLSQDISKMSLNSEFAKRSLRNHLNIVPPQTSGSHQSGEQRVVPPPNAPMTHVVPTPVNNFVPNNLSGLQVGQECMAKYWEDSRFYNAIVTGITDRTYVVKFRDYGNIEEVFKSDCFSAINFNHRNHFAGGQYTNPYSQSQPFNNGFIGKMEFKRRTNFNNN